MQYLIMFGMSLFLTLLFELPIAWLFGLRGKKELLLVMLVNILTNPAVVFLNFCGSLFYRWNIFCQFPLELMAIIVEAFVYYRFSKKEDWTIKHPILLSVTANIFSYGLGCIINILRAS